MKKEFIPHEQALALEKLGFNEECLAGYNKETNELYISYEDGEPTFNQEYYVLAPIYQQAFRWFREKYGYDISIKKCTPSDYKFEIEQLFIKGDNYYFIDFTFTSHEQAEFECLKELIEIVKNK
jgi:hypothetical protein